MPEAEKEGLEGKDPTSPSDDQLQFNRIQYQNFLASVLFMQGRKWDEVMEACEKGIKMCALYKAIELKAEAEKSSKEFASIKLKAMAR